MKVGNLVNAAMASMNIAEILTDRGEHTEAESTLQKTLPVWKSSEYRYFQGACHWMLGRVSLRANRLDEALSRLAEAKKMLAEVGAEAEVQDVDARVAAGSSRATPTAHSRRQTRCSAAARPPTRSSASSPNSTACAATRCCCSPTRSARARRSRRVSRSRASAASASRSRSR